MSRSAIPDPPSASPNPEPDGNVLTPVETIKEEIRDFLDKEVERAHKVATLEVREEGARWKAILEGLGHTIQGVAENTTQAHHMTVNSTIRILIDRIDELERRIEILTINQEATPAVPIPPPNEPLPQIQSNAKGILQDRCVMHGYLAPTYAEVQRTGTPDSPVFCSGCTLQELSLTETGVGRTLRASQQSAALAMLQRLEWPVEFPTTEERSIIRNRREQEEGMEADSMH